MDLVDVRERRRTVCMQCEHQITIVSVMLCGVCKCPISKKIKRESGCPKGKWK